MNYYICDDNMIFAEDLAQKIINIDPQAQTEIFPTLASLIFRLEDGDAPDAIFLDIVNSDGSGINASDKIRSLCPMAHIVYVTGYASDYSQAIFNCPVGSEPAAFLAKPVEDKYLRLAVSKLKSAEKRENSFIPVGSARSTSYIDADAIIYIVSERRQMHIFTENSEEWCYCRVEDMMKMLPDNFCRCHRSYIVNLDKIQSVSGRTSLIMKNNHSVPVGKVYSDELKTALARRYAGMAGGQ